jgi:hypothetical protein
MTKRPSLKALDRHPAPSVEAVVNKESAPVAAPVKRQQPSRHGKKVVTVYLPESVWRDAKMLAARTDTTIDAIMRRGLDLVFAEHGVNRGA